MNATKIDRRYTIYKLGIKLSKKYHFLTMLMVREYERTKVPFNQKEYNKFRKRMRLADRAILSIQPDYFSKEYTDWIHSDGVRKNVSIPSHHINKVLKKIGGL